MNRLLVYLYMLKRMWQKRKELLALAYRQAQEKTKEQAEERAKLYRAVDDIIERKLAE